MVWGTRSPWTLFSGQGPFLGGHSGVNSSLLESRVFGPFGGQKASTVHAFTFREAEFGPFGPFWQKGLPDGTLEPGPGSFWPRPRTPDSPEPKGASGFMCPFLGPFWPNSDLARVASGFLVNFKIYRTDGVFSVGSKSNGLKGRPANSGFWVGQNRSSKNRGSGFLLPGVILFWPKRSFLGLFWPYSDAFWPKVTFGHFGQFLVTVKAKKVNFSLFWPKSDPDALQKTRTFGADFGPSGQNCRLTRKLLRNLLEQRPFWAKRPFFEPSAQKSVGAEGVKNFNFLQFFRVRLEFFVLMKNFVFLLHM